ncbi:Soluble lytic murein transglycosylase precursor [Pseudoalteromonas luteoviolacea B = ATCC 29581]|nr:Soluble lytic murein transglycosylase precursor [Pseudoalteromonas luteoviolacea B = ATCC 29581]
MIKKWLVNTAWLAVGALPLAVSADIHSDFKQAERLAWSGNYDAFKNALAQLDHPLSPYVEMTFYKRHANLRYQSEIEQFLSVYEHTPLEWPVRAKWLDHLRHRGRKAQYVAAYKPTKNAELTCYYLRFQLELGAPEKAILEQVAPLWTVGKSQHKACDPLFSRWQKAGYMKPEHIWERVTQSAQGGQSSLLSYLKTLMPAKEAYLADLYLEVRRDPSSAAGLYRYKHKSKKEAEIAVYGMNRLIWRDKALALRAWDKLQGMFAFTDEQKSSVAYRFALALASDGEPEAEFWLNKVPKSGRDEKLMQWLLANKLKLQDWEGVIALFVGQERLSNGQKYWLGYSYNQVGQTEKAKELWRDVANERHYYGFLAAARLGLPTQLNSEPLNIDSNLKQKVANAPGFKRAKALYEMERFTEARREWNYLTNTSSTEEKLAASQLAAELEWYDSAIYTLAGIGAWDYVELRFPMAFKSIFERYSESNNVPIDWSLAIARRESSFAPDARSHANAFGLMQILPSTAKYINKKSVTNARLMQPEFNVRLGTDYLYYLKKKNDDNEILATASYNAGFYRVKKWVPKTRMPMELWIELIPYTETREYVKNVYAYRQVYRTRLGHQDNLLNTILSTSIGG